MPTRASAAFTPSGPPTPSSCSGRAAGRRGGTSASAGCPVVRKPPRSRVIGVSSAAASAPRTCPSATITCGRIAASCALEERLARRDLVGLRVAVARRPALHDVADVDVLAREPIASIILVSSWPAPPTNGSPCASSSAPGRLADEHQLARPGCRRRRRGSSARGASLQRWQSPRSSRTHLRPAPARVVPLGAATSPAFGGLATAGSQPPG